MCSTTLRKWAFFRGEKCLNLNKSKVFGKQIKLTFALKKSSGVSVKSFTEKCPQFKVSDEGEVKLKACLSVRFLKHFL